MISTFDSIFHTQVINAVIRLSHILVCVNSSANCLIYYVRGEKFRLAWMETFGTCWCKCYKQTNIPDNSGNPLPELPVACNSTSQEVQKSASVRKTTSKRIQQDTVVELHA